MLTAIKKIPVVRALAIERHRLRRILRWYFGKAKFAMTKIGADLPYKVFHHKSLLLRKLGNADMRLQHNKVTNLRLAAATMNNTTILPGETFSLWKLVGRPTAKRGFLTGMLLSNGEVIEGVGGGLCQIANLLYWMALHSPLTVTERYRHSYDVFPDSGRVLPFGSGATIFYNYVDLQFRNDTQIAFQLKVWVEGDFLRGELRSDQTLKESYSVMERDHRFLHHKLTDTYYRENVLFQRVTNKQTGNLISDKLICANHSELKYLPPVDVEVIEVE
ncbi:MAG TPA: VanW family protein [bacterium]|nr:VanW family protein [bacterium]